MRTRDAQRLIFGSLTIVMLVFVASIVGIQMAVTKGATEELSGKVIQPVMERFIFELPGSDLWADSSIAAFTEAIEQFQLAGTFQIYENEDGSTEELKTTRSLAIIDDRGTGRQLRISTGEKLGPFLVTSIEVNQVSLEHDGHVFVLGLSGEVATRSSTFEPDAEEPVVIKRLEDMPALETSRFGKRVSENQWVIDRKEVFSYAEEIMGNPYRATQLFRSFAQTAKQEGEEAGFKINMKGETNFFGDMGLGNGDVIRKVNSMQMKTQIRAEYLVREFMNSRMSAVVLDVENGGETRQQIFIIR